MEKSYRKLFTNKKNVKPQFLWLRSSQYFAIKRYIFRKKNFFQKNIFRFRFTDSSRSKTYDHKKMCFIYLGWWARPKFALFWPYFEILTPKCGQKSWFGELYVPGYNTITPKFSKTSKFYFKKIEKLNKSSHCGILRLLTFFLTTPSISKSNHLSRFGRIRRFSDAHQYPVSNPAPQLATIFGRSLSLVKNSSTPFFNSLRTSVQNLTP